VRREQHFAVRLSHTDRGQARLLRGHYSSRHADERPVYERGTSVLAPSEGLADFAAENRSYRKQSRRFGCQWPAENHDLVGLTIGRSRVPGDRRRSRTRSTGGPRAVTRAGVGTCDQPPCRRASCRTFPFPKQAAVWKNSLRSEPCLPPSSSAMAITCCRFGGHPRKSSNSVCPRTAQCT